MPIQLLSDQLASQIAAGEVVERPASVVKELLENALDAGATTINIEIREGGRQLVQVADNGSGMVATEVETAFLRHATSKLASAADLQAIATLGFRGEALAAIAAVSQVTVVTRPAGEESGTRLQLHGGKVTGREQVGAPQGTVVAVENLFFNVPARLQFLKSVTTERRLIDELVTRYALAYPQVRLRLIHDGRVTFQSSGNGSVRDVLVAIYGAEIARDLLPILTDEAEAGEEGKNGSERRTVRVAGFVGPPSLHRANRNQIGLYVNGRWIRDTRLTYAVIQAYHTLLPTGRYPLAAIFIELPYDQVDVNVHPAKTEVRFRDADRVFSAVQRAVRQTLISDTPVRPVGGGFAQFEPPGWSGRLDANAINRREEWPAQQEAFDLAWEAGEETDSPPTGETAFSQQPPLPSTELGGGRLPIMRVVGQVGAAYIITEGPAGLFLIDQHAAHERILYEKLMRQRQAEGGTIPAQGLVTGAAVHLSPSQATLLEEQLPLLGRLGFQVEPFGPNTFMVRAVPAVLARMDPAAALHSVVEELEAEKVPLAAEIEARIVRRVCKTAAVKAGQTLALSEMEAMIRQLEECHNPHTCPHGRPTLIHLSVAQLARQFGRT